MSSAMTSLSDVTPVLPKRETGSGVGAEESSDDEMGSQISARSNENSGASSSISTTSSVYQPASLDNLGNPHRSSTPHSDTDSSDDDDDVSDHDLTPCNPSPNMSQLLGNWGGIGGRLVNQDDIEDSWRAHVQKVLEDANNQTILVTFVSFGKLFDELKAKTCVITQDSVVQMSKEKVAFSPELVGVITDQLQNLTDILSEELNYPHVWCDLETDKAAKLIERLKFTILEIQENLDNYTDKKDFALECLDAIKTHQKLVSLGEQMDYNMDNEPLDLVKCLYKLHFQLLLLLESFAKLLRLLSQSNQDLATDKSRELALIQAELRKNIKEHKFIEPSPSPELDPTVESGVADLNKITIDDFDAGNKSSDTSDKSNESFAETISADTSGIQPQESEQKIVDLITESKWQEAIQVYKVHKSRWPTTLPLANQTIGFPTDEDDVCAMLNLYCSALTEKSGGIFVMTLTDTDISDSCSRLMDSIQQLSQTIKQLETWHLKNQQTKLKNVLTQAVASAASSSPPPPPPASAPTATTAPSAPPPPQAAAEEASAESEEKAEKIEAIAEEPQVVDETEKAAETEEPINAVETVEETASTEDQANDQETTESGNESQAVNESTVTDLETIE